MTAASRSGTESMLTGTGLVCSFGPTPALRGAELGVDAGEVVAVVGSSGSGKSTLLHCLAGVIAPESGQVRFRGRDITAMSDEERSALRRTEFGFVFQFGQLVPELSVLENIALPLRLNGVARRKAETRAREWAEKLEVAGQLDKRPGEISGGQGQRAALARALVADPSVIFADEPTGALDSVGGEQVMRLLADAAAESGTAVLLVTHEASVASYADREVVIRDGRTLLEETAR
ncbi:ABC transporter ATP-binding protein [Saccharopolyspora gloriosae]|uniref:ABC transporter ATP-binding protein n=1 Tax=Saccharopolyspora gloriosae TaxID=455344 RepID=UPI001FB5A2D3|nr:ABC transporter ATP-binding protein [Saccharopolyspora gloriosae]